MFGERDIEGGKGPVLSHDDEMQGLGCVRKRITDSSVVELSLAVAQIVVTVSKDDTSCADTVIEIKDKKGEGGFANEKVRSILLLNSS